MSAKVTKENVESRKKVERKIADRIQPQKSVNEETMELLVNRIVDEHNETKGMFTSLAMQNAQLLEQNQDLKK